MILVILIKILLVIASIGTFGILPLIALLNQWIWNNIIVGHVLSCAIPIQSFWIILGLTVIGAFPVASLIKMFKD